MLKQICNSKVVFAGAGPGDPDLITVKTLKYLQTADVVVVDRLVDQSLLSQTKLGAKIFFVGKEAGNANSFSQDAINELLVSEAKVANVVLRLKGGDVSFFSNLLSELDFLRENGVQFEIIPGVTAASGAAAYAGIPLTARGFSNAVRFLTYTHPELIDDSQVSELSLTDDTLVFYMSSRSLPNLVARLLEKNICREKWVAVVEQASTPFQKIYAAPVDQFLDTQRRDFKSPSIVIIGKVAKLHTKFGWYESGSDEGNFFPPVSERYLATVKVA